MSDLILFWHRRDLRIIDNLGLVAARQLTPKIVGIFCLDRDILNRDDIAPARIKYMLGCLQELIQDYASSGSQLLITSGKPSQVIPQLATVLKAKAVYWNEDVEPYSRQRDREVRSALKEKGITVENFWDQILHSPGTILTQSEQPYKVYTPFWRNWSQKTKPSISQNINSLQGLDATEISRAKQTHVIELPTAEDLGYLWENPLLLSPGTTAAQARLEEFCDSAIYQYDEQRNFPFNQGTSQLSAALKFGTISIRNIWQATITALENCRSEEARNNIITWQKELAWREFYQHCLYFFPELEQGAYRPAFKNFPWENNTEHFQAWCEGKTGYPIVDAAMRQLNETGWMHNRCRMIVASFLTKDLIIDWRWGEKYFMQTLFDGDLAANNGGWQWSASSGMDPKPLRIFNPSSQANKFDGDAEYIRKWVPEVRSLDTKVLVTGKIPKAICDRCDYPEPIVDHAVQQREFKRLYKIMKEQD